MSITNKINNYFIMILKFKIIIDKGNSYRVYYFYKNRVKIIGGENRNKRF